MNLKKTTLFLAFWFLALPCFQADYPESFYGNYLKLEDFVQFEQSEEEFYDLLNEEEYLKALEIAQDIIKADKDLDLGYFLAFRVGISKKDIDIVEQSLNSLKDKYFFYPASYRAIHSKVEELEDQAFQLKAKELTADFFDKREEFLKEKLKSRVNTKTLLKELAFINDLTGDEDDFLKYMEEILPYDYNFIQKFSEKRKNPEDKRFKELKQAYLEKAMEWANTDEEKIKGLLLVASEMRYWSASLDFSEIVDWNTHVARYISRVLAARDKTEYYEVLAEMVNRVGEDHTSLYFPPDISAQYSNCGVEIAYADKRFLVKSVNKDDLKNKMTKGDEIVSIDNIPVFEYIEQHKSKYRYVQWSFFGSRVQAFYRLAGVLLRGKKDSQVAVSFRKPDGMLYTLDLVRDSYKYAKKSNEEKLVELKVLEGDIYCFTIKRFFGRDVYQDFLELIKDVNPSEVNGVIFDLRVNGGGKSLYGDSIFSHFIDRPLNNYVFSYHPVRMPRRESTDTQGYLSLYKGGWPIAPAQEKKFTCPVAVLISPRTGSASEDFSFCFKYHKRGTIVGLPSAGGTGMGHTILVPGGGNLRITLNVDTFFQWKGLQPDYWVDFTAEDIAQGKDPQLEKAAEILRGKNTE